MYYYLPDQVTTFACSNDLGMMGITSFFWLMWEVLAPIVSLARCNTHMPPRLDRWFFKLPINLKRCFPLPQKNDVAVLMILRCCHFLHLFFVISPWNTWMSPGLKVSWNMVAFLKAFAASSWALIPQPVGDSRVGYGWIGKSVGWGDAWSPHMAVKYLTFKYSCTVYIYYMIV